VADEASTILKDAQGKLEKSGVKVSLANSGLAPAITSLSNTLVQDQTTINDLNNQLRDAKAARDAAVADTAKVDAARGQDLDKAKKDAADDLAKANAALEANKAVLTQLQADQAAAGKTSSDSATVAATELAGANQQITKANEEIIKLETRLGKRRADVMNPIIRQADGKIVRILSDGVCYINLGFGDQVTPGLTFEVYDKAEGVPALPTSDTGDEQLPVGKASIEITKVGTTSSECRIVKTAPGAVLTEGDIIANLVYDPHTKYNFFVYGNFDLANTGRPNSADAEVVKRLITQWGGQLINQVDVDTDFVVLGSEPVLPTFSKDDLTAENQDKLAKAQAELDKYQEIRQQAKDLNIPVLNQNRFLYYVGFYDQAQR
jgi:hypothetical protein